MANQLQFEFDQATELARVTAGIGRFVVEFFDSIDIGSEFHASDLKQFVESRAEYGAPGSPDRVMRDLRKRGAVNYELVSRSKSLYRKVKCECL